MNRDKKAHKNTHVFTASHKRVLLSMLTQFLCAELLQGVVEGEGG